VGEFRLPKRRDSAHLSAPDRPSRVRGQSKIGSPNKWVEQIPSLLVLYYAEPAITVLNTGIKPLNLDLPHYFPTASGPRAMWICLLSYVEMLSDTRWAPVSCRYGFGRGEI